MGNIFAYGSLINLRTWQKHRPYQIVQLEGWVRQWRHRVYVKGESVTALTITPSNSSHISGLLLEEPHQSLEDLDEREVGYRKVELTCSLIDAVGEEKAFAYVSSPQKFKWANERAPILQSYIDCILDGVLFHWGEKGVAAFISSTEGWDLPILNDRITPIYPRALEIDKEKLLYFDDLLL